MLMTLTIKKTPQNNFVFMLNPIFFLDLHNSSQKLCQNVTFQERRRSSEVNQTGSDKHLIDFISCVHNTGLSSLGGRGTKKYSIPWVYIEESKGMNKEMACISDSVTYIFIEIFLNFCQLSSYCKSEKEKQFLSPLSYPWKIKTFFLKLCVHFVSVCLKVQKWTET